MSTKAINISSQYGIEWFGMPANERDAHMVGILIEEQLEATKTETTRLVQEILPGIILLTILEPNEAAPLTIKKINDRVQYGLLPEKYNNDSFIKISYHQLRNICHKERNCSWAQTISEQKSEHRIHAIFFYNLRSFDDLWNRSLVEEKFHIKEHLSNRLLIVTDGIFNYPFNLAILPALCLWRQKPIEEIIKSELRVLKRRFLLFPKIYEALSSANEPLQWSLDEGYMNYSSQEESKSFDYATIVDDILHAGQENNIKEYIHSFNISDLDSRACFPTISVRSLVYLRAWPDALSSLQNGYALCAAIERNGKQKPVTANNEDLLNTFNLWFSRAKRHLCRHQYQARVVLINDNVKHVFSLVGEQVANLAIFPQLIKGLLEQLNLGGEKSVRLIAHNEDVLTIAFNDASWNDINEVNNKAMSLFKMISSDGADPLSLFEEIELPPYGAGTFHLSLVPQEYFELINTALNLKFSLPPGHDHYLLGLSYECLREWPLAVMEFEKALRLDSQDTSILNALGSSLIEMGQYEQAMPFLKRAYEKLPDDADLANTLGRLHLNFGHIDEAISAFERAVRLSPGSPDYLSNLGRGYLLAARPLDALDILNKAIRCDPTFAHAHEQLAELHLQCGDENLAKKHALIAYRENPNDTNIANLLWRLTVGKKDKCNS